MLADYCLMKGRPDRVTPRWRERFIGMRENALGFEALLRTADAVSLPEGTVTEPATLDDIVVYHARGVQR